MALYHKTTPEHHVLERHEGQTWVLVGKAIRGKMAITKRMTPNIWKKIRGKYKIATFRVKRIGKVCLYNPVRARIGDFLRIMERNGHPQTLNP